MSNKSVVYHPLNTTGKDFVVGDIHGCYEVLIKNLNDLKFDKEKDRLFSVGDLIDRGPDSHKCLQLIDEPWFFPVLGNHEILMLSSLVDWDIPARCYDSFAWYRNGGNWYSYQDPEYTEEDLKKIYDLPLVRVVETGVGRINIVHAEFPDKTTDKDIDNWTLDNDKNSLLWGRNRISRGKDAFVEDKALSTTIVGHTPLDQVVKIGSYMYIDTGCVFKGGKLTICSFYENELIIHTK